MKLGCGTLVRTTWAVTFHVARRPSPLITAPRPTLNVKHGGGFGAAAPLDYSTKLREVLRKISCFRSPSQISKRMNKQSGTCTLYFLTLLSYLPA